MIFYRSVQVVWLVSILMALLLFMVDPHEFAVYRQVVILAVMLFFFLNPAIRTLEYLTTNKLSSLREAQCFSGDEAKGQLMRQIILVAIGIALSLRIFESS